MKTIFAACALFCSLMLSAACLASTTATKQVMTGYGTLTAPGMNNHGYDMVYIDASNFTQGGTISIEVALGNGQSSASYDLFSLYAAQPPLDHGRQTNSLAYSYDRNPGTTSTFSYRFGPGAGHDKTYMLGLEGNWFSPAGSTNTYRYTITITGP